MKKYMVKGITKVCVKSTDHLIVPYYIVLLEDEDNNFHIKKVFKEYLVSENFVRE